MEKIKEVMKSKNGDKIIVAVGIIVAALVIFQAGMFTGFKQASFSFRTGEGYFRQMNGRGNDAFMGMQRGDFGNSHGTVGKIISISLPSIVVADKDNIEKTIIVSTSTDIRKFRDSIKSTDLKINDMVVVIGNPDDKAQVEATLIRIMPNPGEMLVGSSTQR